MIEIATPGTGSEEVAVGGGAGAARRLPILPLRDTVTYPDTLTPLAVGQERSIQLVNDVLSGNRMLAMVASRDPELETPGPDDLYEYGVSGIVARMLKVPDGTLRILVQGGQRIRVVEWIEDRPYPVARVEEIHDVIEEGPELTALMRNVQQTFSTHHRGGPVPPRGAADGGRQRRGPVRARAPDRRRAADQDRGEAGAARGARRRQAAAAALGDPRARDRGRRDRLAHPVPGPVRDRQVPARVRPAPAAQGDPGRARRARPGRGRGRGAARAARGPRAARGGAASQAERELSRLEKLPQAAAEHGVIRTYLEWIAALPWDKTTEDNLDLKHAREVLDADHYDIEKVKDRILEFLAVRSLKPDARGSILCLVGPPGVGKTSLGQSIAGALERKFERI